jgi:hypothetical protein
MSVLSSVSIPSQGSSTNLCWAAVTIGVCASLGDPRRSLSAVATKFLPGCQGDLTTDACDRTYDVDAAITGYGHNAVSTGGQLGLAALQRQIDELKRPIPVIMLYPFTNHACLIKGCVVINGAPQIVLLNPSDAAPSDIYYDFVAFQDGTAITGVKWIDSYLVS